MLYLKPPYFSPAWIVGRGSETQSKRVKITAIAQSQTNIPRLPVQLLIKLRRHPCKLMQSTKLGSY